ncbi:hypothetical protein AMECASPLE_039443 [Ameca splendens]|uniref:Uncharacterized protein n=1 Tax=Ameca splendens TaxID=208324 RepID=A0ABV0XLG7_9TELE
MVLGPTAMETTSKLRYKLFWNFQNKLHLTNFQQLRKGVGEGECHWLYKSTPFPMVRSLPPFLFAGLGSERQRANVSLLAKRHKLFNWIQGCHKIIDHMQR